MSDYYQMTIDEWLSKAKPSQKESEKEPNWKHICGFISHTHAIDEPKVNKNCAPVVPRWHLSLNHAWCECPKCKNQPDGLTKWHPATMITEGYDEYNTHCPWCGQPILWDWDEIDRQSVQTNDWKWETVKDDMIAPGDCISCKDSRAVGKKLCCIKADGRWVGDDEEQLYSLKGHPSWCCRIKK